MSRQGYLVLHEKRRGPQIYFFSLEDGFLRYYASSKSAKMVGEVRLSGCKIAVKAHRRTDSMPNSFFLETRKVNVKDRSYTLSSPVRLELSAHSNDDRQDWGKVLFSWQRYYWREPRDAMAADAEDLQVKLELEQVITRFYPTADVGADNQTGHNGSVIVSTASAALSAAKQPLSFLRKNASSLRRSFSMYMPTTTTSSTSTASSSSSSSSTTASIGKGKVEAACVGPEVADCEKDKVVLAKVSYPSEPIYRGDNQQEAYAC